MASARSHGIPRRDDQPRPPDEERDLRRVEAGRLVHGIAWVGGVKWVTQATTWVATLVVARILSPSDYGVVGMAAIVLGLITMLSEFGIGSSVVALRELTDDQIAQLNGMAVILGFTAIVIAVLLAVPLGHFFGSRELPLVMVVLSAGFAITGFKTVPYARLQKEFRFRLLALIDGTQAIASAVASVLLALAGFRYWALVLTGLLGSLISTSLVVMRRPTPIRLPRRGMGHVVTFSRQLLVGRLSWFAYSNADFTVVGRVLGQATLGVYQVAWTLANIPGEKIASLVGSVTPAFLSAAQDDPRGLRTYLLRLTEALALVTFPATFGLALVAPVLVPAALGAKWEAAVVPLQLLAVYAAVRSISPLASQVLVVTRATRFSMYVSVVAAVVLPIAFLIATRWGLVGVALAWMIVHPFYVAVILWRAFRQIDLPPGEYLRSLWPATSASLIMAAVVWFVRRNIVASSPGLGTVALLVATGAVAYTAALALLHRKRVDRIVELLRELRHGTSGRQGPPEGVVPAEAGTPLG